jgi:hypothetical protein
MVNSNLGAFFKAKSEGMDLADAVVFMINTRYGLYTKKINEFPPLYAEFLSFHEGSENKKNQDSPPAFHVLSLILSSFHRHHEIPENLGEREQEELETLRTVISLMHIYEAGVLDRPPLVAFLDKFMDNIVQEYCRRIQ